MKTLSFVMILSICIHISPAQADGCDGANHAQNFGKIAETYFMQMDLNNDGSINKLEFEKSKMSKMIDSFNALQPDKNGFVQKKDFIKTFIKAHSNLETEA